MYTKSLTTAAFATFAFFASTSAFAEDVSYQAQAQFAAGEQAEMILPLPEAIRGMPDSMDIQMVVDLRGVAGVENMSKLKGQGVLVTNFGADISAGKQLLPLGSGANFFRTADFGIFDGGVDFKGDSGFRFDQIASAERALLRLSGKEMASLLQNNQAKGLLLTASGGASTSLLGLESAIVRSNLRLFVQVQVTYHYNVKTEPQEPKGPKAPGKSLAAPGKTPAPAPVDNKASGSSTAIINRKG